MAGTLELALILKAVDEFSRPFRQVNRETERLTSNLRDLERRLRPIDRSLIQISRGFDRLSRTVRRASEPFNNLKKQMDKLRSTSRDFMIKGTVGFLTSVTPIVSAGEFEKALAEVATLTDMSLEEFKRRYQAKMLDLSKELGASPVEVARAMYQAISSGIAPEKALEFLKTAGRSAIAGVSDIFTATDALTTILNSWRSFGYTTSQISDMIFTAVKAGKTTFGEISRSIGDIAGVASSANVSLEEILSAMSALTTQGIRTNQAFTGLKYLIEAIVNPTDKARKVYEELGIEVNALTLQQKGLSGTLRMIDEAIKNYTPDVAEQKRLFSELFSSMEAYTAAVALTGPASEKFSEILSQMGSSAGATEKAYRKMAGSVYFQFQRLKANLSALGITIGSVLLPAANKVLSLITSILSPIKELSDRFPTLTMVVMGSVIGFSSLLIALGAVGWTAGFVVQGITNLRIAMSLLTLHQARLLVSLRTLSAGFLAFSRAMLLSPLGLVATAIAGLAYLIYRNWSKIKAFFGGLLKGIASALSPLLPALKPLLWILSLIGKAINFVWGLLKKLFSPVSENSENLKKIASVGQKVGYVIGTVLALPLRAILAPIKLLSVAVNWLSQNWKKALSVFLWINPITAPVMALKKLINFLKGINLFEAGKKIITTLVEGIKSVALAPVKAVQGVVQKIRNLLPFSPAKEGPLKDLNKTGIRLIQTIAHSITPTPLQSALRTALALGVPAITMTTAKTPVPSKTTTYNISITVNVSAPTKEGKEIASLTAKEVQRLIVQTIRDLERRRELGTYQDDTVL